MSKIIVAEKMLVDYFTSATGTHKAWAQEVKEVNWRDPDVFTQVHRLLTTAYIESIPRHVAVTQMQVGTERSQLDLPVHLVKKYADQIFGPRPVTGSGK